MKIGIDYTAAAGKGGIGTYARNLVPQILRQATGDKFKLYTFLHELGRTSYPELANNFSNWKASHVYIPRALLPIAQLPVINDALVRLKVRTQRLDLFHFLNPLTVTGVACKKIVTVHDLAVLEEPTWVKEGGLQELKTKIPGLLAVDAIIAVSQYTKDDLVRRLCVDPKKISVVYEAAAPDFYPDRDMIEVKKLVGNERYVLYVGERQPRKNIPALIEAFGKISQKFPDVKLVLVGRARNAEEVNSVTDAIEAHNLQGQVTVPGYLTRVQLRKLYSGAVCFVYPSLFEGFGLPVLESLACGVPVITSTTSSLPEIAGDAGLLVDPSDTQAIADAIEQLLSNDALRAQLAARALPQAAKFSWEKAAHETLAVYHKVLGVV